MIVELVPVFVAVVIVIALVVFKMSFRFPKSYDETRQSRELIVKQKRKKEEMEKLHNSMYDDE